MGQWIGSSKNKKGKPEEVNPLGQWISSIELGGIIELVENSNEEVSFGEENWEVISGDTLGDDEGFGPVVMTTLGSWRAWRSLAARQSLVA